MFFCLIITTAILFAVMQYSIDKNLCSPITSFNLIWLLSVVLSKFNFMELYKIEDKTYGIVWIGQLSFNIAIVIYNNFKIKNYKVDNYESVDISIEYIDRKIRTINFIQIVLFISMIPIILTALRFIITYGVHDTRTYYANGTESGFMTTFQRLFYIHYVVFPLAEALTYIQIVLFIMGKIKFKYILMGIINTITVSFISVGRIKFIYLMIVILVAYLINQDFLKQNYINLNKIKVKKAFKYIKMISFIIIIVVSITTILRHDVTNSIISKVIEIATSYLIDGIIILNHLLTDSSINTELLWGSATFAGILNVICFIIQIISLGFISISIPGVSTEVATFYKVGPNIKLNGYSTMYYYFYRDFKLIGIIIFMSIIGIIAVKAYSKVKINPVFANQITYVNLMLILLFGILRWDLASKEVSMRIIYTYLTYVLIFKKNYMRRYNQIEAK